MMRKRVMTMLLTGILAVAFSTPSTAMEIGSFPNNNNVSTRDTSVSVSPQSFYKQVTVSLSSSYKRIIQDDNWWGERTFSVKMGNTNGPKSVSVYVLDKNGNNVGTKTIRLSETAIFTLPEGGGSFTLYARRASGSDGEVTFTLNLT